VLDWPSRRACHGCWDRHVRLVDERVKSGTAKTTPETDLDRRRGHHQQIGVVSPAVGRRTGAERDVCSRSRSRLGYGAARPVVASC
jgi:hypothetical protein